MSADSKAQIFSMEKINIRNSKWHLPDQRRWRWVTGILKSGSRPQLVLWVMLLQLHPEVPALSLRLALVWVLLCLACGRIEATRRWKNTRRTECKRKYFRHRTESSNEFEINVFCCKNTFISSVSRKRATAATTTTKITMSPVWTHCKLYMRSIVNKTSSQNVWHRINPNWQIN